MGLLDDPLGTLFGSGEKSGAIDPRLNRDPAGQRWWDTWERMYQGQTSPENILAQAYNLMTEPIEIKANGAVVPIHRMARAEGLMGLLQPWQSGGQTLEQGRMGATYYNPGDSGILGGAISNFAGGFGRGFGLKLGE